MNKEKSYINKESIVFILLLSFVISCTKMEMQDGQLVSEMSFGDMIICTAEKYMSLSPAKGEAQGSACFGDYFVQGYNSNNCITIYNIRNKTLLTTINILSPIPSLKTHVNTINFGLQRFSSEDYFPLLYISSGYATDDISFIYVYRLNRVFTDGHEDFSISRVQTISLCHFGSWTEGIVDDQTNSLWVKYEKPYSYCYGRYDLPLLENKDISIYREDSIVCFEMDKKPEGSRNQGHMCWDGKIILVTGVPSANEDLALISIDVKSGKRDYIIDLAEIGLINPENPADNSFEPEGVVVYNGQLMICYRKAIFILHIERVENDANYIVC